ncbi:DEAD/DEAH box helicase family protein [Paenibacillus sp. Leaf72]|uniref:DEAD/DEAH box helicase family protein n=1 Tax=Paenibacillus sp. Leaf72 TaxID=1736234 RepID=UPI0006FFC054|nr:DEAD/DEAH box helicase family protein [Paenibacillus sp. Leaf72]KQO18066.1 hypothetical protein ASF12_05340 [Paenibacillus sp. Leaf72]
MTFLTEAIMTGLDWRALERVVARLMLLAGWRDVAVIGGSGDKGADIIGIRDLDGKPKIWVVQVKAVIRGNYVGTPAINQVIHAMSLYNANVAVVATNGDFRDSTTKRKQDLNDHGFDLRLWNGSFLKSLVQQLPDIPHSAKEMRSYQRDIISKVVGMYNEGYKKSLYVVATGLGKTFIAARIIRHLWESGHKRILFLCHAQDLALQLEQSIWSEISKEVPTHLFFEGAPPLVINGINVGLYQTFYGYLGGIEPNTFDVVVIDEAHHALATGFRKCIEHLAPQFLVGMTATPWRGDGKSISEVFGNPIAQVSLVDGMAMGYLAQVDYRLFCDNINWRVIPNISKKRLSIRELNKKLFIPQRDEAIISEIKKVSSQTSSPRIAIFSPSIKHAHRFSIMLNAAGISCVAISGQNKIERRKMLLAFALGKYSAIIAVDLLNEGIDIPDVNLLVFLRATHSRRIFIQQLGRGLRLSPGKEKVVVLDFVSDIRRIADVMNMDTEGKKKGGDYEVLFLQDGMVSFNDRSAHRFVNEWLKDITDLGDYADSEKLVFPEGL